MKLPLLLLGIVFFCVPLQKLHAQCCAAGNPAGIGFSSGICKEKSMDISLFYQHSFSDTYYQGNKATDFKYIDNSYYNYTSLLLNYGLFQNLNISADIGFFFDKTQKFDFGDGSKFNRKSSGIGDASLGLQYNLYLDDKYSFTLIPGFKISLPAGQFDQKDGAVILPIDIQPSSGNFKYEIAVSLVKRIYQDFILLSANTFEFSQRIKTDRTNYKYGNLYNFSLIGIYNFSQRTSAFIQFRNQFREKSSDKDSKLIESTGGYVLFFTPQLSFNIFDDLSVSLQYEIPLYKNMNGIQLTNNYAFGLRISKSIGFGSNVLLSENINEDSSLNFKEIEISGSCEMCKDRIENVTNEFKNVKFADWDSELGILKIGYETEPDFDGIKKALANAGHDNETYTATYEVYNRLPKCCKYRK